MLNRIGYIYDGMATDAKLETENPLIAQIIHKTKCIYDCLSIWRFNYHRSHLWKMGTFLGQTVLTPNMDVTTALTSSVFVACMTYELSSPLPPPNLWGWVLIFLALVELSSSTVKGFSKSRSY